MVMLSIEEKVEHIKRTELFSPLTEADLHVLAQSCTEESFPQGTIIFQEEDAGQCLYIVTRGVVNISKGSVVISAAREGDALGEMALLDDGTRSASALAETDVSVLCIQRDEFEKATADNWDVNRKILKILTRMIRNQSNSYTHKFVEHQEAIRKFRYTQQLNKYMEIGKALTSTLNVKDVLSILLQKVGETIEAKTMLVFMIDRSRQELYLRDSKGVGSEELKGLRIPIRDSLVDVVCNQRTPLVIKDIGSYDDKGNVPADIIKLIRRSALFVPLRNREHVIGFLGALDVEGVSHFNEEYRPYLDILADYVSIALANATNFETIDRLSNTDDVTGYYNTRYLHRRLDEVLLQATRDNLEVSLVFFDMDNFKRTVDTHGHLLGSKVLKEVARFVERYLDKDDSIIRYGGDEYIIILPWQGRDEALAKVQKIKDGMASERFLRRENINEEVSASFGVAVFPADAADKVELLREADRYMYQSKDLGKNRISTRGTTAFGWGRTW